MQHSSEIVDINDFFCLNLFRLGSFRLARWFLWRYCVFIFCFTVRRILLLRQCSSLFFLLHVLFWCKLVIDLRYNDIHQILNQISCARIQLFGYLNTASLYLVQDWLSKHACLASNNKTTENCFRKHSKKLCLLLKSE